MLCQGAPLILLAEEQCGEGWQAEGKNAVGVTAAVPQEPWGLAPWADGHVSFCARFLSSSFLFALS